MPGQRGFTRRNLLRKRQFYEVYAGDEKVSARLTQLPWTHNLTILGQAKRPEEREFYLRLAIREPWSSRELEREFRLGAFERAVATPPKVSAALTQIHAPAAATAFKNAYALEFPGLPGEHSEADLHRGLLAQLQTCLIELGWDLCFVGSEFPLQVGHGISHWTCCPSTEG
jgi:predicted nuclease of restriction endonuclease-like (RecB) superfamily